MNKKNNVMNYYSRKEYARKKGVTISYLSKLEKKGLLKAIEVNGLKVIEDSPANQKCFNNNQKLIRLLKFNGIDKKYNWVNNSIVFKSLEGNVLTDHDGNAYEIEERDLQIFIDYVERF